MVLVRDDRRAFEPFRWGLIPPWATSVHAAANYLLINARGEENTEKRSGDTNSLKSAIKNLDEITQELAHIQLDRMAASYLDQEQEP